MNIPLNALRLCSIAESKAKGVVFPNRLGWIEGQKAGALVVYPSRFYFAVSRAGVDYLELALAQGRIDQAFVLLRWHDRSFVRIFTLKEVNAAAVWIGGQWGLSIWRVYPWLIPPPSVPFDPNVYKYLCRINPDHRNSKGQWVFGSETRQRTFRAVREVLFAGGGSADYRWAVAATCAAAKRHGAEIKDVWRRVRRYRDQIQNFGQKQLTLPL